MQKLDHLKLFFPNVTQRTKIQITKDSFITTCAALTDIRRISEAAQISSDADAKPDRQEESRATTSLPNY